MVQIGNKETTKNQQFNYSMQTQQTHTKTIYSFPMLGPGQPDFILFLFNFFFFWLALLSMLKHK